MVEPQNKRNLRPRLPHERKSWTRKTHYVTQLKFCGLFVIADVTVTNTKVKFLLQRLTHNYRHFLNIPTIKNEIQRHGMKGKC